MSLYFLPFTLKSVVCVCFLFSATKVSPSSATCSNVSSSSLYVNLTTNFNFSHNPQEYYFRNGSLVILPNENPEVHFLCEAPYPIQWIQEYDKDQDGGIYKKDIYGERFIKNFSDPSSYTYQAVVGILYNGTTCHTSNFTCQSVSNPCNQKSVVSRLTGRGTKVIRFEVDDNVTEESNLTKETPVNDSCSAYSYWGKTAQSPVPHFKCEASDGSRRPLEQMVVVCDSAMHCNTYYKHVNKGTKCLKFLPENHVCFGCGYLDHISYKPGFLLCIDNGAIVLAQHYFHSIPQGQVKPDLYFNWNEVTAPQKMMFMEPIDEIVYSGQILTVHCQISRYYFSYGYRLALRFKNDSMDFNDVNDGERIDAYQANRISYTFQVDPEISKIICLAPVWNSTTWINQTVDLDIKLDSEAPSFKHPKTAQTLEFTKGDKNISIKCSAYGKPIPQIHIKKLGVEIEELDLQIIRNEIRNNTRRIEYRFPEATKIIEGTYECTASNFRGSKTETVKIIVRDEMFRILWTLIISGSLTALIFLIIMGLCWKKINDQKAEIRLLTEAEIKEFIVGNPEAIQGTNYLDTGERIDALPYNSKFEIPKERLYIDRTAILGSGAFGQVLKGSVVGEKQNGECLPVAVKTVKQNMEVMYFKSLLSEVKIMAHIGKHPHPTHLNVVSLIGAITQNIRKREIFIAVEFCKNGSLENFLRKFRETGFLNLVKDDEIHMESTVSNHTNPYENCQNDSIRISTVHLIKWAREIANGMVFLGSKKIIHGDLAARNVLLADEYVAKIGDFGLSRQLINYSNYVTSQQCPLPWKWMAVESLCQMKFSVFTDVWAYGITLWEIFTLAQIPYPGISWSTDFLDHLVNGMRMHKPSYATNNIYDVMLECWNLEPTERPSFQYLKKVFEEILSEITPQEYFNPNGQAAGSSTQAQDGQGYLLPF